MGLGVRSGKAAFSGGGKSQTRIAPAESNRSSHRGDEMAEAFGIACHQLVSFDFRCGSRLCENSGRKSVGATIDSAIADA